MIELASQAEADTGTDTSKAMTPNLVKRRVDAAAIPQATDSQVQNESNVDAYIPPDKAGLSRSAIVAYGTVIGASGNLQPGSYGVRSSQKFSPYIGGSSRTYYQVTLTRTLQYNCIPFIYDGVSGRDSGAKGAVSVVTYEPNTTGFKARKNESYTSLGDVSFSFVVFGR